MAELIDPVYFENLAGMNPEAVCKRALCDYDPVKECYTLDVWGDLFEICPHRLSVTCVRQRHNRLHAWFDLFAIHYLLGAALSPLAGQWVSEKDLPGGATFFRGPHRSPADLITGRFNDDSRAFADLCLKYSGEPLDMADAAFAFQIAPRIRAAVLYWEGDEEFAAESRLLFDQNISAHLALDVIYAMAVGICKRLGKSDLPLTS
ncbi:MAG: DUF3786 domain-containing protein [Spirochaetales bacterium]|jgi:hypothetical protein|nr:DUF3786 domain-containing protein [Spirochaetales bacterium]